MTPALSWAVTVKVKSFAATWVAELVVTVKEAGYHVKASVAFVKAPESSDAVKVPFPAFVPLILTVAVVEPLDQPEDKEETSVDTTPLGEVHFKV